MTLFSSLASMGIGARIGSLVGFALLALAAMGGAFYFGQRWMDEALDRERAYVEIEELVSKVDVRTLQLRRDEKDLLLRKDLKYVAQYDASVSELDKILDRLAGTAEARPVAAQIAALRDGVKRHAAQFKAVAGSLETLGLDEKSGLEGRLRTSVQAVEASITAAKLDALTATMLMMRRHEKDFMLRGDARYVGEIDKRRAEFNALLADAAAIAAAEKSRIGSLLDAYQADVRSYATTAAALKDELRVLSAIFAEMQPSFEALFGFADKGVAEAKAGFTAARSSTLATVAWIALAIVVLFVVASVLLVRSITRPLAAMTAAMGRLAQGDTEVAITGAGRGDEIGAMASAVQVFKDNMVRNREMEAEAGRQAEARERRRLAIDGLIASFDTSVAEALATVNGASAEVEAQAKTMNTIADTASKQSAAVSAASEQASANVQTVAAAAEELTSSIQEIGRQVAQSNDVARKAVAEAQATNSSVRGLAEAAERIGEVVRLINDIASQTNLLALNATIEAARAGEAGKGFAVVAAEVKGLATQTAKATEDITAQIAAIQSETQGAVTAIERIGVTIAETSQIAAAIAAAIEEQSAATQEIARNVQQAATGTTEVSSNIVGVSEAVSETGHAATTLLQASNDLNRQAEALRQQIDTFLSGVKAA